MLNSEALKRIPRDTSSFSFFVLGDSQGPGTKFAKILSAMNRDQDSLFAIHLGNVVSRSNERDYQTNFFLPLAERSWFRPMLVLPGNGDRVDDARARRFASYFGSPFYFSFSVGPAYFICLDNSLSKFLDETQLAWFEEELKASGAFKWRFVFLHTPLEDPRKGRRTPHAMGNPRQTEQLRTLMDRYEVTMVFAAHIHAYLSGSWGSTPFIITGGGGAAVYGKDPNASFHHYVEVEVGEDNVRYLVKKVR
jgi:hypothetical protein